VEPEVTAKVAAHPEWRVYEVGISYRGRTYAEGKKIGWRDGIRALWCILKYSPPGERARRGLRSQGGRAGAPPVGGTGDNGYRADGAPAAHGDRSHV
jgi:hypothetical protein